MFLPQFSIASYLLSIFHSGHEENSIDLSLWQTQIWQSNTSFAIAIGAAFLWGALHALSPGHGKTVVGAYLVGSRANAQHALFLGLTTTIAHTTGVFALGTIALFASQFILPEQLYPWLAFISGIIVIALGFKLLINWWQNTHVLETSSSQQNHVENEHLHNCSHHHHHHHSHLPPDAEGDPVSWSSLLALGISSGLMPCPSALVVLLAAIAIGKISFGLIMVIAFSLGMAGALTGLGLLLVSAKKLFQSTPQPSKLIKFLPAASALIIALLGLGMTTQALLEILKSEV